MLRPCGALRQLRPDELFCTKAGVIAFAQTWSRELARYNIRVNAVAPGSSPPRWCRRCGEGHPVMVSHTPRGEWEP